ncbi:MAG: hypothetical protein U5Q03_13615 [Bacteroidota bacterium]|nr:hypothetical protein [Bacteroidota bacterium]
MCEVISETDFAPALTENVFQPNVFNDISNFFEKKLDILKIFESELFDSPYTRSIKGCQKAHNQYRGSSDCMLHCAEAFYVIKRNKQIKWIS